MNITVREMKEEDFPNIKDLIMNELGYQDNQDELLYNRLRQIQLRDTCLTLVADLDGQAVGFAGLSEEIAYELEGNYLRITALAVQTAYQGKGIGTLLLKAVEQFTKEHGISSISLNSGMQRWKAHQFYENFGFHKKGYSFYKDM